MLTISAYAIPGLKDEYRLKSLRKLNDIEIIEIVCEYLKVDIRKVKSKCRKREIVYARDWCIWFLTRYTDLSLVSIGKLIDGDRDHTSIIHSREKVKANLFDVGYTFHRKYKRDHDALIECLIEIKTIRDMSAKKSKKDEAEEVSIAKLRNKRPAPTYSNHSPMRIASIGIN